MEPSHRPHSVLTSKAIKEKGLLLVVLLENQPDPSSKGDFLADFNSAIKSVVPFINIKNRKFKEEHENFK